MTTYRRFYLDKASGAVAVYDTTTQDLTLQNEPLSAPLSYVSRLHFHSSLHYPRIVGVYTGTLSMAAVTFNVIYTHEYVIAAHGLGGTPYVEGKIKIGGVWIALAGSTLVEQQNNVGFPLSKGYGRFLALGANGTNIVLEEYTVSYVATPGYSSKSVDYEIYLTDMLL